MPAVKKAPRPIPVLADVEVLDNVTAFARATAHLRWVEETLVADPAPAAATLVLMDLHTSIAQVWAILAGKL